MRVRGGGRVNHHAGGVRGGEVNYNIWGVPKEVGEGMFWSVVW